MKVLYSNDFIAIPLITTLIYYGIYNKSFKEYPYYKKYYLAICFSKLNIFHNLSLKFNFCIFISLNILFKRIIFLINLS